MNAKLKSLVDRLKDERGKRVMFVAHCILNENTRYLGGAFRSGGVDEIVHELQSRGIGIVQMPCPEQRAWGGVLKEHLWYSVGIEHTPIYNLRGLFLPGFIWNTGRVIRKVAKEAAADIENYSNSGFEVVGVLGVSTSPSCGVTMTLDIAKAFEFLAHSSVKNLTREQVNESLIKGSLVGGEGLFIRALRNEMRKRKLQINFYEHDLLAEMKRARIELDIG